MANATHALEIKQLVNQLHAQLGKESPGKRKLKAYAEEYFSAKDMVIIEFGLPPTFPDLMVPEAAGKFIHSMVGKPLFIAIDQATKQGFKPWFKSLPHIKDAIVWGFGIRVDSIDIPFMVRLGFKGVSGEPRWQ